ncbi:MAG: hypothetical protein QOE28_2424 [Solirubrobacteraceae bacterium]|nr:hypothetical protein [Solirubrobacteraceae bacterium]
MAKRDAFGREIGENTLAGLGSTSSAPQTPRWNPDPPASARPEPAARRAEPATRRPEPAARRPEPAQATAPAAPAGLSAARSPAPERPAPATRRAAAPARQAGPQTARPTFVRPRRRRSGFTRLIITLAVIGGGASLAKNGKVQTDTSSPPSAVQPSPVTGAARSLVRPARFRFAVSQLQKEGRLVHMRLSPARVDATVVTPTGRIRVVWLLVGDSRVQGSPPAGAGGSVPTMAWSRLNPQAPTRLANAGAARLGVAIGQLDYLVPFGIGGPVTWTAYFKDGRSVHGNAAGRIAR